MPYRRIDQPRALGDAEAIITTNLLGPIRMIGALVAHQATHQDATIINVTSGLAFVPFFAAAADSATKAAVHSYHSFFAQTASQSGRCNRTSFARRAEQVHAWVCDT